MVSKGEVISIACSVFCLSLFVFALAIPSIYFGFRDEDSTCIEGTRGGIDLSDWVKIFGFEKVSIILLTWIFLALMLIWQNFNSVIAFILLGDIIFTVIWWVWGVVIISTNENNNCVADGKGMAIMAIADLALVQLSLILQVFLSKL